MAICIVLLAACINSAMAADITDSPTDQQVSVLIEQLGNAEFSVREAARRELVRHGAAAYQALVMAEEHDDLEVASQARMLARQIRVEWTREGAPVEIKRLVKDYEMQPEAIRMQRLRQLAALADGSGIEWLCRILFFESSRLVSKQGAMLLIEQGGPAQAGNSDRAFRLAERTLARSRQPAAELFRCYLRARREPATGLPEWQRLIDEETKAYAAQSTDSKRELLVQMLRVHVDLLDAASRADEVAAALRRMVELDQADPTSLLELLEYLAGRKAWSLLDELETKHAAIVNADPNLLYALARARLAQGDQVRADRAAQQSLKIAPSSAEQHLKTARMLEKIGLTRWSDDEYRLVIGLAAQAADKAIFARFMLSESLHDRQQELEAAETLKGAVDAMDKDRAVLEIVRGIPRDPNSVRSRMHYFFALHFAANGDRAKEVEHLDAGIKADPSDGDVLIALHRLQNVPEERRRDTREKIAAAVKIMRTLIQSESDDSHHYNQLAWLVGNTEGDIEEAIRASQRSIELRRIECEQLGIPVDIGGYLDTLAHCYYRKGDFAAAVKSQTEATEREPHSQTIARQLVVFRRALEEQQAGKRDK